MIRYLIPIILVAAVIGLLAWMIYRWKSPADKSQTRPQTPILYLFCTGCVAAALLALTLF